MTTARDILTAARALIAPPEAWTVGAYARRKDRSYEKPAKNPLNMAAVHFSSSEAVCFCSYGAINRAGYGGGDASAQRNAEITLAKHALARAMGGKPFAEERIEADWALATIAKFNDADGRTHAEVLSAFDKAIEELSQ